MFKSLYRRKKRAYSGPLPDHFSEQRIPDDAEEVLETDVSIPVINENTVLQVISGCLREIIQAQPLEEKHLMRVVKNIQILDVPTKHILIRKGDTGKGIYFIVHGKVEILDSVDDDMIVISEMIDGEYFGEVSTLYDIKATATVKTATMCKLLLLEKQNYFKIFKKPQISLMDWFLQKRYIPTKTPGLEDDRVIRRRVLQDLSNNLPLLQCWNQDAIKLLILSMSPEIIVVYPPNSSIILHGDPSTNMFVVLSGSVRICHNQSNEDMRIGVVNIPFIIGETGYFNKITSNISATAVNFCQVVILKKELLDKLFLTEFGEPCIEEEWNTLTESFVNFYNGNKSHFGILPLFGQFEVLQWKLSQCTPFKFVSSSVLYSITLRCHSQAIQPCIKTEIGKTVLKDFSGLILLLIGKMVLIEVEPHSEKTELKQGGTFWSAGVKTIINEGETAALIILFSNKCLQKSIEKGTDSDREIPWIADFILNCPVNDSTVI